MNESERRKQILQFIILIFLALTVLCFLILTLLYTFDLYPDFNTALLLYFYFLTAAMSAFNVILYVVLRYSEIPNSIISSIFLLFLYLTILISEQNIHELYNGRGFLYFALLIILSGIILPEYYTIITASVSSTTISVLAIIDHAIPNPFGITIFFIIAFSFWLFSSVLNESIKQLKHTKRQYNITNDVLMHDISNINQSLFFNLELLGRKLFEQPHIEDNVKFLTNIREDTKRIKKVIESVKNISSMNMYVVKPINLNKALEEAITMAQNRAIVLQKKLIVKNNISSQYLVLANELLSEGFFNIIENSLLHTPAQLSKIEIELQTKNDGRIELFFRDTGPGMKDKNTAVTSRFNVNSAKKGTGLGITMVNTLMDAIDGNVVFRNRKNNAGLEVRFTFLDGSKQSHNNLC